MRSSLSALGLTLSLAAICWAEETSAPLVRVVDVDLGQTRSVELHDGSTASVKLLSMNASRGSVMGAVREVEVTVEVNGRQVTLSSGNYRLPVTVAGVQIDCPVTGHYNRDSHIDHWGLEKDVRLRLWPVGSPWIRPGTFVHPIRQCWLASATWFSNEPVSSRPNGKFYYHAGLDFGGAEALDEVLAATDGLVVSSGGETLPDHDQTPVQPRADVVYVRDRRGWYYRYSHLFRIDDAMRPGARIRAGQPVGLLGKEGASGGWAHLHFEIKSLQPSGKWGTQDAYAFVWEAYRQQYGPSVIAVARPRHLVKVGERVRLDATRSWAAKGIQSCHWTFFGGSTATGATIDRAYDSPGTYSEVLEVTDKEGRFDYDFAIVRVLPKDSEAEGPPGIHAAYHPTLGIQPGQEVTFKVRARGTSEGHDVWDFGDGSPSVMVQSNVDPGPHAPDGYAETTHRFSRPGHYLVSVRRRNQYGTATAHLYVPVGVDDARTPRLNAKTGEGA